MQLSVYKFIFKDPDYVQLAPSSKVGIRTYTKQITFYVTSHEGSVVLSCKTSLSLNLIHPCSNLDQIPHCDSLICSNVDHPMKKKSKKRAQRKYLNQCVLQENKSLPSKQEYKADVNIKDDKNCQINRSPLKSKMYEDKKCQDTMCEYDDSKSQSTMKKCSDRNCQENENIEMRPKKPKSHMQSITNTDDMQLPKPAVLYKYRRLYNDKNCQSTRCYKKY